MYNSKLQSVANVVGTSDLSRTRYLLFRKEMFIFPRNEKNGSPAPTQKNVAIDQAQIVMGEQHCFVEEGEISNIYNKNLKNTLSVPIFWPLIVVVARTGLSQGLPDHSKLNILMAISPAYSTSLCIKSENA